MRTRANEAGRVPGIVIFLLLIPIAGVAVVGARRVFGIFGHDWQTVSDIRSRDAETVREEAQAGSEYTGNLKLSLNATRVGETAKGLAVQLSGMIANAGNKDVIKAVAEVTFLPKDTSEQPQTVNVILFDGSELSVTSDKPLGSGETRPITKNVNNVIPGWDEGNIKYKITQIRVDVGRE